MSGKNHFLVIDDESEISDLLCLYLSEHFGARFSLASNGNAAIDILKNENDFNLIFCDFRMAMGTGFDVYDYLKKEKLQIPFILVTSDAWESHPEFHNDPRVGYLEKPFDDQTILAVVNKLLPSNSPGEDQNSYVGISIATLLKIHKITCTLFIKLNDSKFVKYQNANSLFGDSEFSRVQAKGVDTLYIERNEFSQFIDQFRKKVVNEMIFKGFQSETSEAFGLSDAVQEVTGNLVKSFGLSKESQELTKKNIQLVQNIIERNEALNNIFDWALNSKQSYGFQHSVLLCYLTGEIASSYDFGKPFMSEIFSLASFLHDISLTDYQIRNEEKFIKAIKGGSKMNHEDLEAISNHPSASHKSAAEWQHCPAEVLEIVQNHHENSLGTGFPSSKKPDDLSTFVCCFIVCEDFVRIFLELKNHDLVLEAWTKMAPNYSHVKFQPFYQFLKMKFSDSNKDKKAG